MKKIVQRYWPTGLGVITIALLACYNLRNCYCLAVFNDEFGYWGNAAALAGFDWSSLLARTPYYSLGYSILLVPLMKIGLGISGVYKAAVLLNMLFLGICYVCALYVCGTIYPRLETRLRQLICFASVISCATLYYSQLAWCETYITMLYWCLVALFVKLEKKWSYIVSLLVVVVVMAIYIVHQRAIMLIPLAIGILMIMCIQKKKYVFGICVLALTVLCVIAYRILHDYQIDAVYGASEMSNMNNVSVSSSFVGGYMTRIINNSGLIIISFLCKTGVMLIATFFTILIAYRGYIEKLIKRKYDFYGTKTMVVLFSAIMLALSSIQMFSTQRKDFVVYSRYMDYAIPPLCLLGLGGLMERTQKYRKTFLISGAVAVLLVFLSMFRIDYASGRFNVLCSPIWGSLIWHYGENNAAVSGTVLVEICVLFIVLFAVLIRRPGLKAQYLFLCLLIAFNVKAYDYANDRTNAFRNNFYGASIDVAASIREYPEADIYCLMPDYSGESSTEYRIKELQFLLWDRPLMVLDENTMPENIPDESFIVTNGVLSNEELSSYCEGVLVSDNKLCLYKYDSRIESDDIY